MMNDVCTWPNCAHTAKDQCKGVGLRSDTDTITALRAELDAAQKREALAADLAREWEHHCKTAEAEVERLREALGFYANGSNWNNPFGMSSIIYEGGKIARAALNTQETSNDRT